MSGGARAGMRSDGARGAGSVLALAVVAVTVATTTAVVGVAGAWDARRRAATAADAAALGAADVAVGRVSGDPCERAELLTQANGAELRRCALSGVVVEVSVAVPYGAWEAASARAGPPGTP